jgi:putative MFS transporter
MLKPPLLQRLVVGSWVLITINTLIFGFVIFLPQFFLRQGLTITNSLAYTLVLSIASLVGCAVGAYLSDAIGRRASIIGASIVTIVAGYIYARFNAGADPAIVLSVGFILIVAIYVQTAILFGVYTPELFPTEIRLRANGICNTLGRGATVVLPAARRGLADDRPGGGADRGGVGLGRRAAQSRAGGCRGGEGVMQA